MALLPIPSAYPDVPFPAKVDTSAVLKVMARITQLAASAIKRFLALSRAKPLGLLKVADVPTPFAPPEVALPARVVAIFAEVFMTRML